MKYEVNYYDPDNGAWSPIDVIETSREWMPGDYIEYCNGNADYEWCKMLHKEGSLIELIPTE